MGRILFLLFSVSVFFCVSCGESWSETAKEPMNWDEAVKYCDELVQKSYDDWHLPTIDELRRRIANCPATRPEGECSVSEENGNLPFGELEEACKGCPDDGEKHSLGDGGDEDTGWYWSSSARSEDAIVAFRVNFDTGEVGTYNKDHKFKVRCTRANW
ncbi:DUF1566 domain-containing protein [bacterium]|nr:DUF1566 domain-containing protein [bacterium]